MKNIGAINHLLLLYMRIKALENIHTYISVNNNYLGSFLLCSMQALADSEEAQICVLHNVFELWRNHRQMMCVLIDKLLKTQIVECSAVATWVFSKEMNSEFTKMYLWEILHLTIKKMNKHVIRLGKLLLQSSLKKSSELFMHEIQS